MGGGVGDHASSRHVGDVERVHVVRDVPGETRLSAYDEDDVVGGEVGCGLAQRLVGGAATVRSECVPLSCSKMMVKVSATPCFRGVGGVDRCNGGEHSVSPDKRLVSEALLCLSWKWTVRSRYLDAA